MTTLETGAASLAHWRWQGSSLWLSPLHVDDNDGDDTDDIDDDVVDEFAPLWVSQFLTQSTRALASLKPHGQREKQSAEGLQLNCVPWACKSTRYDQMVERSVRATDKSTMSDREATTSTAVNTAWK